MKTVHLRVPLSEADVLSLEVGDVVYVSGPFYTCRSLFQRRAVEEELLPPLDFKALNLMVHVGPVLKREGDGWRVVSFDPTSSIRFEKFGPRIIEKLGVRAIIGKTTMGEESLRAMERLGCVHLTKVGIYGNVYAGQIVRVREVHDLDLLGKTEATWVMEADEMGPFIVDMDSHGNSYFDGVRREARQALLRQYEALGIPVDYGYNMTEL